MISSCVYSTRYTRQGSIAIYTFVDIILSFNISVDLFGCTVNIVGDTNVGPYKFANSTESSVTATALAIDLRSIAESATSETLNDHLVARTSAIATYINEVLVCPGDVGVEYSSSQLRRFLCEAGSWTGLLIGAGADDRKYTANALGAQNPIVHNKITIEEGSSPHDIATRMAPKVFLTGLTDYQTSAQSIDVYSAFMAHLWYVTLRTYLTISTKRWGLDGNPA